MSAPSELPEFQVIQYRFAAHLRDPLVQPPLPDLEARRLQIYRDLFYNNVESFLRNAFPVLRKLSSDDAWHARVRDFYSRHRCTAPQFYGLAEEFLHFLESERGEHPDDPPFMTELAHYEWVEMVLSISEDDPTPDRADPNGDLLDGAPVLSPVAWPLAYAYPVHRIGPELQPQQPPPEPTYLVVYRNRQDAVKFLEVNAVTARLLQLIEEQPGVSGRELLLQIAADLQHPQPEQIVASGSDMLVGLRQRDIVLGTLRG
ncbi:DNA-binding domain-containing protein [Panacagrimonas sp.]|uniref:HvfC family RiPP maturation protein n=1 Tax=Panacagrimonas sp. TaxID=2480088 RepID=UPI003B52998C